ncbi:MAG: rod shape-determining protein [Myxococcota bacterium]
MLDRITGWFAPDVAVDLGTARTSVFVRNRGIVVSEPSVLAVRREGAGPRVVAVGQQAHQMLGRTPGNMMAVRPLHEGVIADFDATAEMLRHFLQLAVGSSWMRPRVIIAVPVGITEVEKRAVREAAEGARAREVHLIEEPIAAAIGAGLPITEPAGCMLVDVGAGTTEAAIISLGGIVHSRSVRVGGERMDQAIISHLKRRHSLLIGERTAEEVKLQVGAAAPVTPSLSMSVKGRDLVAGVPRMVQVTSDEIREALQEPVNVIVETVRNALERTPPELAADIAERGICLTGGGAQLRMLDRVLAQDTGVAVRLAEDPVGAVAVGGGKALEHMDMLSRVTLA